jgi:MYXO-CTERM domain-containing protein
MRVISLALLCALCSCASRDDLQLKKTSQAAKAKITGELKRWHRVTLTFDGPSASEAGTPNPFLDHRLDVTFTGGGKSYTVPGFFAADGDAGQSSADSGNKWRVRFAPPASGTWSYKVSFRKGTDVAVGSATAGSADPSLDGDSGTFTVAATDKSAPDHRGRGMLQHVGGHHLRFAGDGTYFLKGGADSPENFLAFFEFDGTPSKHKYAPHAKHYKTGDPTWKSGKGKNIIGALNYLAGKGMNSVYFLTMNVNGDGKDVWPWTSSSERLRFDCSKLDQWEVVFSHIDRLGIMLQVLTQETENDQLLDGGNLGKQRKLYYRELIARFAHHPAITWNLGEENTNTDQQRADFAAFFKSSDPYQHPVVVHTYPGQYDKVYNPLVGNKDFDGPSLQMGDMTKTHAETKKWIDKSAAKPPKWIVSLDEIGPASTGVKTDANDYWHDDVRRHALWGNLMAGGAGVEWYFGYQQPHDDLDCEDWASRDHMWDLTRFALELYQKHLPFWTMKSDDGLVTGATGAWCLAKAGEVYAVYLPQGGAAKLSVTAGDYDVSWYDPRAGGALVKGSVTSIKGPGDVALGEPPKDKTKDWVAVVKVKGAPQLPKVDSFTLIDADTDQPTIDPLADGATVNLAFLSSKNLNIRANVSGSPASVVFDLDGQTGYRVENTAPFALEGDTGGDYAPWTPALGSHTLTATPFTGTGGTGAEGTALTIKFVVSDDAGAADTGPGTNEAGPTGDGSSQTGDGPGTTADGGGGTTDDEGCSCRVGAVQDELTVGWLLLVLGLGLLLRRRRG